MNVFDLQGPEFLQFYVGLLAVGIAAAIAVRWWLRQPGGEPGDETPALSPYEVAYLSGGESLAVDTAIARLLHEEVLSIDYVTRKLEAGATRLPPRAPALDKALFSAVDSGAADIKTARAAGAAKLGPIRERLQELGLIPDNWQAPLARWLPTLLLLLVAFIGAIKVFIGLSRNRPVTFLVILCVATLAIALLGFGRQVLRSRRGDQVFKQLKRQNAALQSQASRRQEQLAGDDIALAVGLFGLGILASGRMAQLHHALYPPTTSSGSCSSSSCGGGGCGGGCGGGGCGGCGG